ncbi:hypothetical protein D1105_03275 [Actinobacillus pleuropneumoniae]|nr:hypothetical protein D1112_03270 [Actinobacillus pleuropneumoniae]UKH32564.1 hypothetical protein D1103_03615 [Actinobacillus pleuropneumoniae serovar 10 str. D13039]UKH45370.1 hypothetical protein D1095_03275 [Actinobacillus pleuropneumoniae serovar 2 str. S1536]UKH22375.1 hypothetical protein D1108_03265 [Actinobacillus pleuropneumoniae]UKH28409.1 hypothetical protein D1105_03275 [Actinobacillus pleuropneumoniae]
MPCLLISHPIQEISDRILAQASGQFSKKIYKLKCESDHKINTIVLIMIINKNMITTLFLDRGKFYAFNKISRAAFRCITDDSIFCIRFK